MSASGRFRAWLGKTFSLNSKEPPSEAHTRPVRRLKPLKEEEPSFSVHEVSEDVTHVCYDTRKLMRPKKEKRDIAYDDNNDIIVPPGKKATDRIKRRGYIIKKDPVTKRTTRVKIEDVGESPSKIIYYDEHGKLLS